MGEVVALRREAPTPAVRSPDDGKRLIRLMIRDIAHDLGRGREFDKRFGRLVPDARDHRLLASVGSDPIVAQINRIADNLGIDVEAPFRRKKVEPCLKAGPCPCEEPCSFAQPNTLTH